MYAHTHSMGPWRDRGKLYVGVYKNNYGTLAFFHSYTRLGGHRDDTCASKIRQTPVNYQRAVTVTDHGYVGLRTYTWPDCLCERRDTSDRHRGHVFL